jgi:N-acetylmuramoyl-L-alanine amidase
MKISNHRFAEEEVTFNKTPNQGGTFDAGLPDTIIIHYTAGSSAESSVNALCDKRNKASAHLVVGRDGSVTQLVPFNKIAWHAGKSAYGGRTGFNKYSIGIEIDNAGRLTKSSGQYLAWFGRAYPESEVIEAVHRNESEPHYWHRYTEEQISRVNDICVDLVEAYKISSILGHEEISPRRKTDPGPAFPLDQLRERVLYRERSDEGPEESATLEDLGMVTASRLNIRSSPMKSASTVAPPLPQGTMVNILQENGGWYEVQVRTRGWVKKEYIKT